MLTPTSTLSRRIFVKDVIIPGSVLDSANNKTIDQQKPTSKPVKKEKPVKLKINRDHLQPTPKAKPRPSEAKQQMVVMDGRHLLNRQVADAWRQNKAVSLSKQIVQKQTVVDGRELIKQQTSNAWRR